MDDTKSKEFWFKLYQIIGNDNYLHLFYKNTLNFKIEGE